MILATARLATNAFVLVRRGGRQMLLMQIAIGGPPLFLVAAHSLRAWWWTDILFATSGLCLCTPAAAPGGGRTPRLQLIAAAGWTVMTPAPVSRNRRCARCFLRTSAADQLAMVTSGTPRAAGGCRHGGYTDSRMRRCGAAHQVHHRWDWDAADSLTFPCATCSDESLYEHAPRRRPLRPSST